MKKISFPRLLLGGRKTQETSAVNPPAIVLGGTMFLKKDMLRF